MSSNIDTPEKITPRRWGEKRYHSLDYDLKKTYGEKIYKLSLQGGMTCPNRDGKIGHAGCAFCSKGGSGDFAAPFSCSPEEWEVARRTKTPYDFHMREQIEYAKQMINRKADCKHYIAYFQSYTNTYAPVAYLRELFQAAIAPEEIAILSIGTRADCLGDDVIEMLARLNQIKPVWVELGFQTMHESSHAQLNTGFSLATFESVVNKLHKAGIKIIVHVILGLPNETEDMMLASIDYLSGLPIWGIKLQLLYYLKHTQLGQQYESGLLSQEMTLDSYTDLVVKCMERIPPDVVIHRLTGDGPKELLLAPTWSSNKKQVLNTIQKKLKQYNTYQGKGVNHGRT